jgi:protein-L-isoaspartate(D-aspartate) O-methyltransferase
LDIGCGTGYLCAAFYEFVKDTTGTSDSKPAVIGVEHINELCMLSEINLKKKYSREIEQEKIKIVCDDGRQGYRKFAPYDVIHVGASSPIVPVALMG